MDAFSAPFNPQQVEALQWLQKGEVFFPCVCEWGADNARHSSKGAICTADPSGLVCPSCGTVRDMFPAALLAWAIARKDRAPLPPPSKRQKKG